MERSLLREKYLIPMLERSSVSRASHLPAWLGLPPEMTYWGVQRDCGDHIQEKAKSSVIGYVFFTVKEVFGAIWRTG